MLVIVGRYSSIGDLNYLVDATIVSSKILNKCIKYICYKKTNNSEIHYRYEQRNLNKIIDAETRWRDEILQRHI